MDKKEKNIVDKFLEQYENISSNEVKYKRIYVKPSKFKSIIGFMFSLLLLIIVLSAFSFSLLYFLILIGVLLTTIYYGVNLFTKNGFGLPKRIIDEDNDNENEDK